MLIGDTSDPQNFQKTLLYNPLHFCEILGNNEKSLDTDIYT